MNEQIFYKELPLDQLDKYENISFTYKTTNKYELKRVNNGLGGILLELIEVPEYYKDFGSKVNHWRKMFDLKNWKFFVAYNENNKIIAGCTVAINTPNCNMLEGRDDLALLWDIRVDEKYKHKGIGQCLFYMAKSYAVENGFKQLKVECQNTNPSAVNFYHKQGMKLCAINEYAYPEYPDEVQLLWYLDL